MVCGAVLGRDRFVEWPRQKLHDADGDREVAQRVKIRPGVSMEAICQVVCRAYDVSEEVLSARWSRDNDGRDVAIYLARRHSRQSLRVIGTYFGELSPSSVSVVHKRLSRRLSVESELQDSVQRLEEA